MAPDPALILDVVSAVCSTIFLLFLPFSLYKIHKSPTKVSPSWKGRLKAVLALLLALALLSPWIKIAIQHHLEKPSFMVSVFASILAAIGISLSFAQEQQQYSGASDLDTIYLLTSTFCDGVYMTMPCKEARSTSIMHLLFIRFGMNSMLLILNYCAQRPVLRPYSDQAPEELCDILSRVFFTWVIPILSQGYSKILVDEDLPPLSQDMKPKVTRDAMVETWSQRVKPETKRTLPLALLVCLRLSFLAAILPRLFLIVFRYAQPILIRESIRYVETSPKTANFDRGYWLIVQAAATYIGLAVTTAVYQHRLNKLKLMTRSALSGLIHDITMKAPSIVYDDAEAITLMSTDADSLDGAAEMFHETWAQIIEVVIGITLLASQVGWIWPLPLLLIYLCSHVSRFVAKRSHHRQRAWNQAIQDRLGATTSMLGSMKTVKMLGFQQSLTNHILELRAEELRAASKLRWIMVYYNASANALGIFSPAITLIAFAILSMARGDRLDTETAFTTMAISSMVTHPANMIMTIMPRAVAAFAAFDRIQSFLVRSDPKRNCEIQLASELSLSLGPDHPRTLDLAVQFCHVAIGHRKPLLKGINIEVATGSLTIISGPTGVGKSTLLRAMLGEVVPSSGSVTLSDQPIAYCAQKPWLPTGTIKDVIYGASRHMHTCDHDDGRRYQELIDVCCLRHDLDSLSNGDQTQVGSRGLNLSGGQRQRVALARALFARCDILLLDDTFSSLDGQTEQSIFDNLFGLNGLIRCLKTTVVLVTNSDQHFRHADHIVVLGDHGIQDQGSWENIKIDAATNVKLSSSRQIQDRAVPSTSSVKLDSQLRTQETGLDLMRKTGDPALYNYYLSFIGFTTLSFFVTSTVLYAFFITFPPYWLRLWTEVGGRSSAFYIVGYIFLSTMSWASTSVQMWSVLVRLAPQSGSRLHERLLDIVSSAPLSFFSHTETGSILNRFSQDIQLIDKQLPPALQTVLIQICKLVAQVILLCGAEKWLALSLPPGMLLVFVIQKVYLRTSRQLRFLELESRAHIFSSFLESVEGLETIRSFGWSRAVIGENIRMVENAQRPEFLLLCLQRWLNIVLDLLAAAVAISAVVFAVCLRERVSGAQVGIALNVMLVANTILLRLVQGWTTLEISLGAIARLRILEKTTGSENTDTHDTGPQHNWPHQGQIEIKGVTASYHSESIALQNVSLNIRAGQKLVVCGRTGSGKSTLLLALLRLVELQSGKIEVDGIDIKDVDLTSLRQRCFITVSQEPLILTNETLRFNLDPDGLAVDQILAAALNKTGLWSHFSHDLNDGNGSTAVVDIPSFSDHPILDRKISQLKELSVGQSQLLALCRALVKADLLRNSGLKPILLLDEATSSLDLPTESLFLRIIDEEFAANGHTVIIVAHRLGSLEKHLRPGMDSIAFLSSGELVEVIEDLGPATFQRFRRKQ